MNGRNVAIVVVGVLVLWMGLRSFTGYRHDTEHLHGGEFVSITCDGEQPVEGQGWLTPSAAFACEDSRQDQRGRAPWWILLGLGVTGYGVFQVRRARSSG
jgi:hypothetical protein